MSVLTCVRLFMTPWTLPHQAPLSMGFPRQDYWSGLLFPPAGDFPHPGIESMSLAAPALVGGSVSLSPMGNSFYVTVHLNSD